MGFVGVGVFTGTVVGLFPEGVAPVGARCGAVVVVTGRTGVVVVGAEPVFAPRAGCLVAFVGGTVVVVVTPLVMPGVVPDVPVDGVVVGVVELAADELAAWTTKRPAARPEPTKIACVNRRTLASRARKCSGGR